MAYVSGVHGIKQIGEYFGLHYSRVTRVIAARDRAVYFNPTPLNLTYEYRILVGGV